MAAPVHLAGVHLSRKQLRFEELERCIERCQAGELRERIRLARNFRPLIRSLAERRAGIREVSEINRLSALGRAGLYEAVMKYKPKLGAQHFRIFALDYIERAMDGRKKSLWQQLFRR